MAPGVSSTHNLSEWIQMAQTELWTPTALVVDDDDLIAKILQFVLSSEGYSVRRAADGRAVRELIATEPPPDLVTLDFLLPDDTGVDLLATMRATPDWKHVPVLFLSATPRAEMDRALETASSVTYLEKPFRAEDLRGWIVRLRNGPRLQGTPRRVVPVLAHSDSTH
jgi:DNA-binding response OmpR family regulator